MNPSHRTLLLWAALLTGATLPTAQRTLRSHASPTGGNSFFGRAVEGLGDVDGDGRADYAISGNGVTLGGNGAGSVRAFSGATGTLLWTANGTGSWVPCGSSGGTTGDFFGFDIERVPDFDNDGIDDLAVGAPFTGVVNGGCRVPNFGQVRVLSGATGATLLTTLGPNAEDFYGTVIKRVPDMLFDGVDEYLVRASTFVDVIDGATGQVFVRLPLASGDSTVCGAGDFDGDGLPWEIAIGNPGTASVSIVNVLLGPVKVFKGPAGSQFGTALEFVSKDKVLIGAPGESSNAGAVYLLQPGSDANALTRISLGQTASMLGSSLSFGGNADLDGLPNDVLAGAPGNNSIRLMTLAGSLIQDVTGTTAGTFGNAVDWVGGIILNGFDEIVVGDAGAPGATGTSGNADVLFGGPATSLNQNFGPGCNPSGGPVPTITQSTGLRPGGTYTISLTGAPAFAQGTLALGMASSTGISVPPCRIWMSPTFQPITVGTIFTNFNGNWSSAVLNIPFDPNLIGLPIAHQAAIFGASLVFTNATASTIGW